MVVTAPKDGNELRNLLATAAECNKSFSIRYPKGSSRRFDMAQKPELLKLGEWEQLSKGTKVAILATGTMVGMVEDNLKSITDSLGFSPTLINSRFIKPLDVSMLTLINKDYDAVITIEEGCIAGGFGSAVVEYYNDVGGSIKIGRMGVPDNFIEHGRRQELLDSLNLNPTGIVNKIKVILDI
jgi:1-deoxy-D-xylulose-5-phosphate synthase